jgi:cell wall-associated NlpC family hydrolase
MASPCFPFVPNLSERKTLVQQALTWERTPYHHNQSLKGVAVDCVRFVNAPYAELGWTTWEGPRQYPPDWHLHRGEEILLEAIERRCARIDGPPLPADVAVWQIGRCYAHCAIVIDWPLVIHAWKDSGAVVREDVSKMQSLQFLKSGNERPRRFYRLRRWAR